MSLLNSLYILCGQKIPASYKNLNIYYHVPNNQPLYLVPSLLLPFNAIKSEIYIIHFTFKPQIYVEIFNLLIWRTVTKMIFMIFSSQCSLL